MNRNRFSGDELKYRDRGREAFVGAPSVLLLEDNIPPTASSNCVEFFRPLYQAALFRL